MKWKGFFIIGLILGSFLTGCSSDNSEEAEESHIEHVNGDLREETQDTDTLPAFLDDKNEDMQMLYTAASQNKDLLENIPCYCGCGDSVGHRSNYDCFIHENKQDGSIVWDDHATKCGVCLEIAAQSIVDHQDGKSIKQIRNDIDQTYEEDYAEPTPTPEI
ncbi:PCYCGC motif-containing (lipo)protein [Halobacillus sp. BBL2006]|uniref:PCYCGC motif-containing (lipo)protein n=1 Tax=Halobacillus sp. BBL2006 TaxID=1543706 RepID=UPI00054409E1|nr:PCYCGC motif-containing (lipo)protein [Halobacillus sp. BBL2006]KHE72795.1 extracellular lipoprotein with PCYCGC motif [Halobacillus sp. BBL2006]